MNRVLIVEDNRGIALTVAEHLTADGYETKIAASAEAGLSAARTWQPDLLILDLMLPDEPGEWVLSSLRADGAGAAVLILSAKSDEMSKVRGFRVGADDYLTKPFGIHELLARTANLLRRRAQGAGRGPICFGDVKVDPAGRRVTLRGAPVDLRPRELDLLFALVKRPGQVWTRRELLNAVWGYDPAVESRTVDWHMAELRRKLGDGGAAHLHTVRKAGYRFEPES
ncbi:MAG: response regulator transcription factor [Gemmatimonadales bacterium]